MSTRQEIQSLIASNELCTAIHDALFDMHTKGKTCDIAGIIDDAICWIAELHLQNEALREQVSAALSAGFLRLDTSNLTVLHPVIKTDTPAVDDDWLTTGKDTAQ